MLPKCGRIQAGGKLVAGGVYLRGHRFRRTVASGSNHAQPLQYAGAVVRGGAMSKESEEGSASSEAPGRSSPPELCCFLFSKHFENAGMAEESRLNH